MVDVWGEQAVVASNLPDLDKEKFEDAILSLWAESIDGATDPALVATACVIVAMQYANYLDSSVQDTIAEVVGLMK